MRTLTTTLMAALAVSMIGLSSTSAEAGCGGGYKHHRHYRHAPVYRQPLIRKVIVEKPVVIEKRVVVQNNCFDPHHCHCFVRPGDTWITIAKREYGNPNLWPFLAKFNNATAAGQLSVGQQIQLPKINQDGTLQQSPAPAPAALPSQPGQAPAQQLNQQPAASPAASGQPAAPLAQVPASS